MRVHCVVVVAFDEAGVVVVVVVVVVSSETVRFPMMATECMRRGATTTRGAATGAMRGAAKGETSGEANGVMRGEGATTCVMISGAKRSTALSTRLAQKTRHTATIESRILKVFILA